MKIFSALFITLAGFIASNPAAAGTIRFTGSISEPACVADAAAERAHAGIMFACSQRAASVQELNFSSASASHAALWNLASVTQTATRQRRDIVITYR